MSVTEFAKRLKVSRVTLSRVLNGHAGVSAELAIRLEAALGSSAQMWVGMQSGYDLAQARKQRHPKIERLRAA
jgi:antitoxin HigA-1